MAQRSVIPTVIEQTVFSAGGATTTTGSVPADTAPALYILHCHYARGASVNPPATVPTATGAGLTWAKATLEQNETNGDEWQETQIFDTTNPVRHSTSFLVAYGAPSGGALTITNPWTLLNTDALTYSIVKITGTTDASLTTREIFEQITSLVTPTTTSVTPTNIGTDSGVKSDCMIFISGSATAGTVTYNAPYAGLAGGSIASATNGAGITSIGVCGSGSSIATIATVPNMRMGLYFFEFRSVDAPIKHLGWSLEAVVNNVTPQTITCTWPSGYTPKAGDFAICCLAGSFNNSTNDPQTEPSGWTRMAAQKTGTNSVRNYTYYKVLTGGDAAPSWLMPLGGGLGLAIVGVYRGVNQLKPIAASGTISNTLTSVTSAGTQVGTMPTSAVYDGDMVVNLLGGQSTSTMGLALVDTARGWKQAYRRDGWLAVAHRNIRGTGYPTLCGWYGSPNVNFFGHVIILRGDNRTPSWGANLY